MKLTGRANWKKSSPDASLGGMKEQKDLKEYARAAYDKEPIVVSERSLLGDISV